MTPSNQATKPLNFSKRRLIIVSDAIYPFNKGGKETRIYNLSTRLSKLGWEVHIYTMHWWASRQPTRVENGVTLHALCPKLSLYSGKRRSIRQALLFALSCFSLLTKLPSLQTSKSTLIEADSMPYIPLYTLKLVSLIAHIPLVAVWHEVWPLSYWKTYAGGAGIIGFYLEKIASHLPNHLIAVSPQTAQNISKIYNLKSKISRIHNGVDLRSIEQATPANQRYDFVFAGRLLSHKRVDLFLDAAKLLITKHPSFKFAIIGEGPEKQNIELRISNTELRITKNVTLLPFFSKIENLYSVFKASKVFVLPSQREGFGLSIIEANACGIPAVTVDHPDNAAKDLVKDGANGYIAKLTSDSLAHCMEKALELSKKAGTRNICIQSARHYDWDKIARDVHTLYTSIV